MSNITEEYDGFSEHEKLLLKCWKHKCDVLIADNDKLTSSLKSMTQRAVNAEMELLALKSPIPSEIRAKMDADRKKCEPEWLNQALNEGDGTYKP